MSQPLQRLIIERARALIAKPQPWTKDTIAATADNRHLGDATDPRARRFCAIGAIMRSAYEVVGAEQYEDAGGAVINALCSDYTIMEVNDFQGRRAVLRLFDKWLRKSWLKVQRCTAAPIPQKLRAFD